MDLGDQRCYAKSNAPQQSSALFFLYIYIQICIYGREIFFLYIRILSENFQILIYKKIFSKIVIQKVRKFKGKSKGDHTKFPNFRLRRSKMENILKYYCLQKKRRPKGGEIFRGSKCLESSKTNKKTLLRTPCDERKYV